jgi:hypothetical protein
LARTIPIPLKFDIQNEVDLARVVARKDEKAIAINRSNLDSIKQRGKAPI